MNINYKNRLFSLLYGFIILGFLSSFVGCAAVRPVQANTTTVIKPELNVENSEELGNTLLRYSVASTKPSIRTEESFSITIGGDIPPQLLAPEAINGSYSTYYGQNSFGNVFRICHDRSDNTFFSPHPITGCEPVVKVIGKNTTVKFTAEPWVDINRPQFLQELIYNGRVGTNVKFLYREFSGGMARAPFSQEVQYDLNEGTTIGFKGARMEILDSSNRSITYKVTKYFDR